MKNRWKSLLPPLLICLAAPGGCSKSESRSQTPSPAIAVTVAPVTIGSLPRTIEVIGTLYGDEEATVSAKISGRVVAVHHDVGDRVPRGAPLAQLDTTDYALAEAQKEAALAAALAKLGLSELPAAEFDPQAVPAVQRTRLETANAESRYNRGKQLHNQTPPRLSDQEFADLQTAWEVARSNYNLEVLNARTALAEARTRAAELRQAEQMLADATVRAPGSDSSGSSTAPVAVPITPTDFAVAQRLVSLGEYVREGTPLFRLIDDDPIKLRAAVPERYLAEVKVGQPVRASVEAYRDAFQGKITRINPQVDPASRNFMIEAVLPNAGHELRPGGFSRARIETRVDPSVMLVPQSAVLSFAGVHRVFSVAQDKTVQHEVELGERVGDQVEIKSGLEPDESIIISEVSKLSGGIPVIVSKNESKS